MKNKEQKNILLFQLLSIRVRVALHTIGIENLDDLADCQIGVWSNLPGIANVSLKQIIDVLSIAELNPNYNIYPSITGRVYK